MDMVTFLAQSPVKLCVRHADALTILQAASFSQLNKAKLGIWDALQLLKELDQQRADVSNEADEPQMCLFDHAIQTAELCRLRYPQQGWMHLVGLIHSLGHLMALPRCACHFFHYQHQFSACDAGPVRCVIVLLASSSQRCVWCWKAIVMSALLVITTSRFWGW